MTVYLVGAGPGDPGLITVRGAELLARADCIVHDRLANPALLELAPATAERISVGKAPGAVEMTQEQINATLVERGKQYGCVVRLKGGDPYVFGRGGEEAEVLAAAGIAFEVVPGITSSIAAAAYAGIPVTHRTVSTSFTVVTGHEDPAKGRTDTDWDALAKTGGTLVILMGAARIGTIAQLLIEGGRAPDTPVAAVRNGTRNDQSTIRATLATIGAAGVKAPSAIVVGHVAALDFAWFEHRPLFGRRIVVTRAREQASELRTKLEALGAQVLELPTIAIEPIEFELPQLRDFPWIVFTSANGVDAFFERGLYARGLDARELGSTRVGAIGTGTEAALSRYGVRANLVPPRFVAESLVEAFPEGAGRVLIARAQVARDVLPDGLAAKGWNVEVLDVYRTVVAAPDPGAVDQVRAGDVDAVTFTSSSTVQNFHAVVGALPADGPTVASIGPITSDTARSLGYRVDVEADPHTIDGLVQAVLDRLASAPTR
ncbi:MAG: uroporphyrinogen-III C-methyltransferase [Acidimicrobiia bacterium]